MAKYHLLIIEDNASLMERLCASIRHKNEFEITASYRSPEAALKESSIFQPDLILFSIDQEKNLPYLKELLQAFPTASIICTAVKWSTAAMAFAAKEKVYAFLNKPFTGDDLLNAVHLFLDSPKTQPCQVLAFFSPKGKSGKTTLIANLALSLAAQTGKRIGIIDADLQFGDMSVFLNLNVENTIMEAVRDINFLHPLSLNSYFQTINEHVYALCGTKRPEFAENITPKPFIEMLEMAKTLFDYILIDLQPAFNPISIAAAEASTTTYMIAMVGNGFETLHVRRAIEIFRDWPDCEKRLKLVYTRVEPYTPAHQDALSKASDYRVDAIIPNDYLTVSKAANNGHMVVDLSAKSAFAQSIGELAQQISGYLEMRWQQP